jgi:hypothetical protein
VTLHAIDARPPDLSPPIWFVGKLRPDAAGGDGGRAGSATRLRLHDGAGDLRGPLALLISVTYGGPSFAFDATADLLLVWRARPMPAKWCVCWRG